MLSHEPFDLKISKHNIPHMHMETFRFCIIGTKSRANLIPDSLGLFRDFDKVDRVYSIPNEGRSMSENTTKASEKYFELSLKGTSTSQGRDATLSFHTSTCPGKQVAKVTCQQLECGLRPTVSSHLSR